MIKKTLCFSNPAYLSQRDAQLVIKLPEVEKADILSEDFKKANEITRPIEDIGVLVLSHKQITITSGALEALLENNCAVITCDSKSMPVGLLLPLVGNTTQEPYRPYVDRLVYDITEQYGVDIELSKDIKAELLSIPTLDVVVGGKRSPLMVAVSQTTASLYKCFSGELRKIAYPEI